MLKAYLISENLKFRHSIFKKMVVIVPIALIVMALSFLFVGIGFGGFSSALVNNWCMPIGSVTIVILCHFMNLKEQRHAYRTLYSLPIDLKKIFGAKVLIVTFHLLLISLLLAIITFVGEGITKGFSNAIKIFIYYFLGYGLLWISLLWQIPFNMFLDQKIGFIGTLIFNLFFSALGGLFFSMTKLFWLVPYSWTARYMIAMFGVLPNGLLVTVGSKEYLNLTNGLWLGLISLFSYITLSVLFSYRYERLADRQ